MFQFLKKIFGTAQDRLLRKYQKIVLQVNALEKDLQSLSDDELRAKTNEFKQRIRAGETVDDLLPEAYAVVKNTCRRFCGTKEHVFGYDQSWDMIPYDVQILGAIALHYGSIAEMQTGEGKTLTATLPLYLNALTGKSVQLVTTNDYLCERDCAWVGTILRWLGLTTGVLTNATPVHERKEIYKCDVIYGTASEFGFDYLRDNSMVSRAEEQVQRGYYFAIVDEIDSILIDEARTPLIISGPVAVSRQMYDDLKQPAANLVRLQRELCHNLGAESRKVLESLGSLSENIDKPSLSKEQAAQEKEALRKLWLVSKGMPRNKVLKRVRENPDLRAAIDEWDIYFFSDNNKEEKQKALAELFVVVDEKANEYELTERGIQAWSDVTGGSTDEFVMLDLGGEYAKIDDDRSLEDNEKMQRKVALREADSVRKERSHNLRQMLRAHLLMEKDIDYIVQEDKVIIIDEHTGRPQPGRRFSDGLHQAIEAKESVSIQKETQTYATITLQNYFRMYDKLAGMSGTAITEAHEFKEIYKLEVLCIPTYKSCSRKDFNDEVYMTEREKYQAIIKEIKEVHDQGRPILIGTESVEVSEKLSRICKQNRVEHAVLNAKQHASEAEIIANAGQTGSVTISTNMAGRGTDIKLGKGVADLGGLYVIGTTRHHSRRIDRQLRGRSGRLGDPGSSKFFVSFEDQLMRLFASPRMTAMLKRFRPPEGEPISAGILNRSIETAQKRIEQRNYTIRKHTLEYDDVMNKQRQEIYAFRNEVLHSKQIATIAIDLLGEVCSLFAEDFFKSRSEDGGWDPSGYRQWLIENFPVSVHADAFDDDFMELEQVEAIAISKVTESFSQKLDHERVKIEQLKAMIPDLNSDMLDEALRSLIIRRLDQLWQEHLWTMDHLRTEVHLRSIAQKDPLIEFKQEAFILFNHLGRHLKEQIARDLFRFEIVPYQMNPEVQAQSKPVQMETNRSFLTELSGRLAEWSSNGDEIADAQVVEDSKLLTSTANKVGRNDECSCGSGKKFKKCCGAFADAE
ncbi:MAG: preprotein translocase subunit SecA [Parachlamydiales bacterium]|nr:preprotein translocase subunit SecA [Parachlamydiales bacterium]